MEEYKTLGVASLAITFVFLTGCGGAQIETSKIQSATDLAQTEIVASDQKEHLSEPQKKTQLEQKINLSAEALGKGKVLFTWELSEGVEPKEKYRIIRSEKPEPEFNKKNYWVQVDKAFTEFTWTALTPDKSKHFRLCVFDSLEEACELYSNNVEVEIR